MAISLAKKQIMKNPWMAQDAKKALAKHIYSPAFKKTFSKSELQAIKKQWDNTFSKWSSDGVRQLFPRALKDIDKIAPGRLSRKQMDMANKWLSKNKLKPISVKDNEAQRRLFNKALPKLKDKWKTNSGKPWPKERFTNKTGQVSERDYEAHHLIQQKIGGVVEWWNIVPLSKSEHTGVSGVHRAKGAASVLLKTIKALN